MGFGRGKGFTEDIGGNNGYLKKDAEETTPAYKANLGDESPDATETTPTYSIVVS